MSFGKFLDTLFLAPIRLLFELIFGLAYGNLGSAGWSIIALSLVMNLLLLPLYRRTDKIQQEVQNKEHSLQDGVRHIKKTFTGKERMMMLQTYYRQNNYKQTDALRGSAALILEIPFFIAAYQFLSSLKLLEGKSFGAITNLAAPDGLLKIAGFQVNVLPLLMTVFTVLSTLIYTRKASLQSKIQLYAMAVFFLVFLYSSPSALLLYWACNNLFSLLKNLLTFNPLARKWINRHTTQKVEVNSGGSPLARNKSHNQTAAKPRALFLASALFLTLLIGVLIPSTYIAASPQEYVDINNFEHPAFFVLTSFLLAAGVFLVWLLVFYRLSTDRVKRFSGRLLFILSGTALANYMFFGKNLGIISPTLQYEEGIFYQTRQLLLNWLVMLLLAVVLYLLPKLIGKRTISLLVVASLALSVMSVTNLVTINNSMNKLDLAARTNLASGAKSQPNFTLSKKGKNVVVLMFDRALGSMLPYILNEKPGLAKQIAGFTYYPNTVSFGNSTNFGVPPLLGGYEYTPVEMNKRSSEKLVDKHNEALKLMPVLFDENGFDVTVCDPPYANYQWYPDLKIYQDYPEIKTYITKGWFNQENGNAKSLSKNHRNFFLFSLMKTMPQNFQPQLYDQGNYRQLPTGQVEFDFTNQTHWSMSKAQGISKAFMDSYNVLLNLPTMTKITEKEQNTFLFLANETTHEQTLLQAPEYKPAPNVDNKNYDTANAQRFQNETTGRELKTENFEQMAHYHVNMIMMLQLGQWFDDLRKAGVYDNTRIIIASDHGRDLQQVKEMILPYPGKGTIDMESYYPLLMVKDFNAKKFSTANDFMTNADVPTLALSGLIENPVNPFTGKAVTNEEKYSHEQFITLSRVWQTDKNNGTTFLPSAWASIKDDIWKAENWTFYPKDQVLSANRAD
ncbi:MAG: membrane protein insertase YidC [Saccharofermentanales bacterium]|jgi:YidC/Oxa1 family membrane protein insertase